MPHSPRRHHHGHNRGDEDPDQYEDVTHEGIDDVSRHLDELDRSQGGDASAGGAHKAAAAAAVEEDDHHEMTEEEKDLVAVRCLRFFNVLLMLIGGGLCGASLWATTSTVAGISTSLLYAVAGVGGGIFVLTMIGLVGALARVQQILLVYHTCLIFAAFAMLILGGFCFILYDSAVQWVRDNWVYLLEAVPPAQRAEMSLEKYEGFLIFVMYGIGATAIVLLSLLLCAMSHVVRLVTPLKAYTLVLQATNTTLLPVGIALIGVGAWVADTAIGMEAVFSAFAIFVLGMAVVVLVMMGCTSISLRSRGLIRVFCFITLFLTAAFVAFGITAIVSSDTVTNAINSQWATLRRLLPSSFAGKYDFEQFQVFVKSNLKAVGFFALATGCLMATQTFGAVRLRFELKAANELEDQAIQAEKEGLISKEDLDVLLSMRKPGILERMWKRTWTKGTKLSRAATVFTLLFACFIFLVVMGVAVAALYYSTSCTSVANFGKEFDYDGQDLGPLVRISNNYTRGLIRVQVNETQTGSIPLTTLRFKKVAYAESYAAAGYPGIESKADPWTVDVYGAGAAAVVPYKEVVALPAPPARYFNFDVSCQDATFTLSLPPAHMLGVDNSYAASVAQPYAINLITSTDQSAIELDWSKVEKALRPRLFRVDVSAGAGALDVSGLLLGPKGMFAESTSGEITLKDLDAACDPADLGSSVGGVRFRTEKGGVTLSGAKVRDCDVFIRGGAARCSIQSATFANALGGAQVSMESEAGVLDVSDTRVDFLSMKGDKGTVRATNVTVGQSLKVSTGDGKVELTQMTMALRAGIQVDTDIGAVEIWASQFAGIVSVVTGGTIVCTGKGFDGTTPCGTIATDTGADGTTLSVLEQVNVNCASRGDCAYLGGITITSARGNVILRMDKWANRP